MDTAIISTDPHGNVTSWNEGAYRILGWTEREMLGVSLARIFVPEDRARGLPAQETEQARMHGRGGGEEGWRICKDGSRIWAAGELSAVRGESGSVIGYVKILRDRTLQRRIEEELLQERAALRDSKHDLIGLAAEAVIAVDHAAPTQPAQTDRMRVEEALRQLNATLEQQVMERNESLRKHEEALRQSQKMEAVGQLTGGVAHDFNNLLQIILANLESIRRTGALDPRKTLAAAEVAMSGARRAAALTQKLLAFARRQPLAPRPVDVNELVHGMAEILHRTLGETITVSVVQTDPVWRIEADTNELESAILNLAVNARDAMPEGGSLTIETANASLGPDDAPCNADVSPGQYVLISISDTGKGMDAQTASRAFEPFFTTKPMGQGTGLGLSQVYGFVKQSGGHVTLHSEVGHGTSVKIYLRRWLGPGNPPDDPSPTQSPPPARPGESILLVEDDEGVRTAIVSSLGELGYRAVGATDGLSAMKIVRQQGRFHLLLTDVVLPNGITGAELARQIRSIVPEVRVLYTTGYARNSILHQGRADTGVQLLSKPFSYAQLANKVREVLDDKGE